MNPRVITFHYTVSNHTGELLDSSRGETPMAFLEGVGQIIPGLEKTVAAMAVGERQTVQISVTDAYGYRDSKKVMMVPREEMPSQEIHVGDLFQLGTGDPEQDAEPAGMPYQVTELSDQMVTLDGNHPLAGIDLFCDVEVMEIREATAEECEHGHAHSADAPHHH